MTDLPIEWAVLGLGDDYAVFAFFIFILILVGGLFLGANLRDEALLKPAPEDDSVNNQEVR